LGSCSTEHSLARLDEAKKESEGLGFKTRLCWWASHLWAKRGIMVGTKKPLEERCGGMEYGKSGLRMGYCRERRESSALTRGR
jgi:hypothetical protein